MQFYTSGHPGPVHQKPLTRADMSKFRLFCDLQDIRQQLFLDDIFNLFWFKLWQCSLYEGVIY